MTDGHGSGLLGEKLSHSFSPEIHALFGEKDYRLIELPQSEAGRFIKSGIIGSLNVTFPYKKLAFSLCDELSEEAHATGAVNTVINRNGRLFGYNTDVYGFTSACEHAGITFRGAKVLILGTGATAGTVAYASRKMGAASVGFVSRTGDINYGNAHLVRGDADIIVNTSPYGMYPSLTPEPLLDLSLFKRVRAVFDVVFNPLKTALILSAESLGIAHGSGLYMLTAQAARSREISDGASFSREAVYRAAASLYSKHRGIVLTGMPGCGKSTLGNMLAGKLGREFTDTDTVISERAGKSIPLIFSESGERSFRTLEAEAVRDVSGKTGRVISLGGGAVLDGTGMKLLKQNNLIIFIDRDTDKLESAGRPLSGDKNSVIRLYNERIQLYNLYKDLRVPNNGALEEALLRLISETEKDGIS